MLSLIMQEWGFSKEQKYNKGWESCRISKTFHTIACECKLVWQLWKILYIYIYVCIYVYI